MSGITPKDLDEAKKAATSFLYEGNRLIETAIREPVEDGRGNQCFYLEAELVAFREKLIAEKSKIEKVQPYLLRIVDKPVEHDGSVATSVHSLAHDFAFRLYVSVVNTVSQLAIVEQGTKGETPELLDGEQCFQRENLSKYWEPIRDGLREKKPIDAYRLGQMISIESAKAKALLETDQTDQDQELTDEPITPAKLADRLGIPKDDKHTREALRKRLEAWRNTNKNGGWIENANASGRQPRYFYPLRTVWSVVEDMKHSS